MNKTIEQWVVVKDYPTYEVSSFGNVRRKDNQMHLTKIRMNTGYYCVHLGKKMVLVHRLVAKAFCVNNSGYKEVNHIDEDKSNNTCWNIEWCDRQWNNTWGTRTERAKRRVRKAVECISMEGEVIKTYKNASMAVRDVQGDVYPNLILMCCKGQRETAYGYKWRYSLKVKFSYDKVAG